jgi:outer membrane protein OmpA-like peptidoglycan-associated protein
VKQVAIALVLVFLSSVAHAPSVQAQVAATNLFQGTELNLIRPTPFSDSGVVTDTAMRVQPWSYSAQFLLHYARNPLVWRNPDNTLSLGVSDQLMGHVLGHVAFLSWLQVGIDIPMSFILSPVDTRGLADVPTGVRLGDIRLHVKAMFLNQFKHFLNMGIAADLGVPSSGGAAYIGSSTVSSSPRLILSRRFSSLEVAANLGARIRAGQEVLGALFATQLSYHAMVRWNLPWRAGPTSYEAIGELWGLTAAARPFSREAGESALEWLVSGRVGFWDNFYVTAGVGGGFIAGYGSPDFRALLSVAWAPRERDRDFDGIVDRLDSCPDIPEVYNGIDDDDGCPESDRDGDGIIDFIDKCPDEKESKNGYQDEDGCPDRKPRTVKKRCKPAGEVTDASENDEPDEQVEYEECAEPPPPPPPATLPSRPPDRDHDGVPDADDKCPDQPETINGKEDEDGCPDAGKGVTVFVSKQKIGILEKINFETASAVIKPESFTVLDQVAAQLRAHPEVKSMRIEGHTDSVGADDYNQRLSQARSESVLKYLMEKGRIEKARLLAKGYGESKPIAPNSSPRGRAQNRRVEFVILEQDEAD